MIHDFILPVLKTSLTGVGFLAAVTIDEATLVPVGSAIFVLIGVWHFSARIQRIVDCMKETNRRLDAMEGGIKSLPCQVPHCPSNGKKNDEPD